jgi:hypothetical protein
LRPGFEPLDRLKDLHGIRRDREERLVDAAFDHLFEQRQRDGIPSRHPGGVMAPCMPFERPGNRTGVCTNKAEYGPRNRSPSARLSR